MVVQPRRWPASHSSLREPQILKERNVCDVHAWMHRHSKAGSENGMLNIWIIWQVFSKQGGPVKMLESAAKIVHMMHEYGKMYSESNENLVVPCASLHYGMD
jgi:hypothetical protein